MNFSVGDKVKLSEIYINHYSARWVDSVKEKSATVVSIKPKTIKLEDIPKEDIHMYRTVYGYLKEFPLFGIGIKYDGFTDIYQVSQFGIVLDK